MKILFLVKKWFLVKKKKHNFCENMVVCENMFLGVKYVFGENMGFGEKKVFGKKHGFWAFFFCEKKFLVLVNTWFWWQHGFR